MVAVVGSLGRALFFSLLRDLQDKAEGEIQDKTTSGNSPFKGLCITAFGPPAEGEWARGVREVLLMNISYSDLDTSPTRRKLDLPLVQVHRCYLRGKPDPFKRLNFRQISKRLPPSILPTLLKPRQWDQKTRKRTSLLPR